MTLLYPLRRVLSRQNKKDPSWVKFCAAPIGEKLKAAIFLAQSHLYFMNFLALALRFYQREDY
jgi:hypothetical protein